MSALWRRIAIWSVLAVLLVGGLVYAFLPRAIAVEVVELSEGPLVVSINEEGQTRVRDSFLLYAPVAGRSLRIEGEVGDPVTQNETVVAQIEPIDPAFLDPRSKAQAEAALQAAASSRTLAEAEVRRAAAELEFSDTELTRARALIREKTISQRELDEAERRYNTNKAMLESARAALQVAAFDQERARAQLLSPSETHQRPRVGGLIPIRSPATGRILKILNESERVVAAGETLAEIGDPADLEIVVDLLSADAVKVAPEQRVVIEGWGGDQALEGRVRRVEPFGFTKISALGIEEQRVNVIIDLVSPREQWQRLGHGYQVDVRIVLWEGEEVLRLPLTALFRAGEGWAVFVDRDGRAVRRVVEVGRQNGIEAEIIDGLEAGARVLVHPSDRVVDGVRIRSRFEA